MKHPMDPRIKYTQVSDGHVSTISLPTGSLSKFETTFLPDGDKDIERDEQFNLEEDALEYHDFLVDELTVKNGPTELEPHVCKDTSGPASPEAIAKNEADMARTEPLIVFFSKTQERGSLGSCWYETNGGGRVAVTEVIMGHWRGTPIDERVSDAILQGPVVRYLGRKVGSGKIIN